MKEFKVNVNPLIKKLEIFSKKGISGFLSGEFRSIFKGRGLEFHGYRNYNPSEDDAKSIDWKASMRSRYLVVKELVEEKNNNILFFVDVSSTMSFGSAEKLKNEFVIEMFASLSYTLLTGGDSVGLALFSNRVVKTIQPNIGTKQYYMMLRTITSPELYEGEFDLAKAIHDLSIETVRRSIIIIISDFIGLKGNWYEELKLLAAKHEVIAFVVNDQRDLIMPEEVGQVFVEDPNTGESLLINTKTVKQDYERIAREENQQLSKKFEDLGIDSLFITTDQPFNKRLMTFFKKRAMG